MSLSTLCQVKTAINLDQDTYPNLWELYFDDDYSADEWEDLIKSNIYEYWTYLGDDDAGFKIVILFETDNIPHQQDFIKLVNSFSRLDTKLAIKKAI